MKKIVFFTVIYLLAGCSSFVFSQDQNHTIKIDSLRISADRTSVISGFGNFSMSGIDDKGRVFQRQATQGVFNAPFMNCLPCRKATEFEGIFYTDSWLTGGTAQGLNEWANLGGLNVSAADWRVPTQFPFNRPIVKYVPLNVTGLLKVTDSRSASYRIIYTAPQVSLSGYMKVEFIKSLAAGSVEWRKVEIVLTEN